MVTETIKSGYRQTELCVIPEDWNVATLENLGDVDPENLSANTSPQYEFTYISIEDVNKGKLNGHVDLIFRNAPSRARRKIKQNDILIGTVRPNLKSHLFIRRELHNFICSTGFSVLRCYEKISAEYVYYHLFADLISNQIERILIGSNYPAINKNDVQKLQIPLPPTKEEQSVIAQVLSETDELIEMLHKLITKKKNLKKGAMQELLTGKRRLPGFSKEWGEKKLGEYFILIAVKTKTKYIEEGGKYLIMDMGSVSTEGKNISNKTTNYDKDFLHYGDLVMPKDDIGGGNIIGKTVFIDEDDKYILGDHVYKLKAKDLGTNTLYFSYLINSHSVNSELKKKVAGSAQLGLNRKSIEEQDVEISTDISEQSAIAQVLLDMDVEIESLKQKRDKYLNIKKGMMQQLLTGRIRLT